MPWLLVSVTYASLAMATSLPITTSCTENSTTPLLMNTRSPMRIRPQPLIMVRR